MYKSHGVLTELWVFIKRHIVICVLIVICIFVSAKYSNIPAPSWLPISFKILLSRPQEETSDYEWWGLMNNLSLAFIASIITYLLIQYIPERKKADKAFTIIKHDICSLYSSMSRLIDMYLSEIKVEEKREKRVTLKQLSSVCNVEISDRIRNCRIRNITDGKDANVVSYGYNLFKDSKEYAKSIQETILHIKETICAPQLDSHILDTISTIENNRFLQCFLKMKFPFSKTPGYQNVIHEFDKGLYEFIRCHLALSKYDFAQTTYNFIKISDAEMKAEREEMLFMTTRLIYKIKGAGEAKKIADNIIALEPTSKRLEKSVGVLLEMLVYYDMTPQKNYGVLQAALKISEYIRQNETEKRATQCAFLNSMQIKKRMNTIFAPDIDNLKSLMNDETASKDIILGASILCEEYEKATSFFESLPDEEKDVFIQLPIYHLWKTPPVPANPDPHLFISF